MDTISTFYTKGTKTVSKALSCLDPVKRVLQQISPLSPFIYALITFYYLRITEIQFLEMFSYVFIGYTLLNGLFEICSKKKEFATIRSMILNVFYTIACMTLIYCLFNFYLTHAFTNYSSVIADTTSFITAGEKWYSKIFAIGRLALIPISSIIYIYKAVVKYMNKSKYKKINIYPSFSERRLFRRYDEYENVDLKTDLILPLVGMVANFFTVNDPVAYALSITSILGSFEVFGDEKEISQLMPLVFTIISSVLVMFSGYFLLIQPPISVPLVS